jgi:hypothetical protein
MDLITNEKLEELLAASPADSSDGLHKPLKPASTAFDSLPSSLDTFPFRLVSQLRDCKQTCDFTQSKESFALLLFRDQT